MLPLKLSIEGLYSYQEKQIIDFENLTDAGLFGIFGAVGSGKSTILEAIGFVLYGNTERMNSQEKRSYNMLNLKSKKAYIDFEFLNFDSNKFRFTAEWSRKKKFNDISTIERRAYKWSEEILDWIPLLSIDAAPVVGLSYDNFKRTIIIPQGKFKEFLELGGSARADMMKEIFHLERFDLHNKVGALKSVTLEKYNQLKGRLEGFEEVSQENIDNKKIEIESNEEILVAKKIELELLNGELNALTKLKDATEEVEKKKVILATLTGMKTEMDALSLQVQEYELVEKQFKAAIGVLKTNTDGLEANKVQKKVIEEVKVLSESQLETIERSLKDLLLQAVDLQVNKNKVLDYSSLIKLKEVQSEIDALEKEINGFSEATNLKEASEKNFIQSIEKSSMDLIQLKTNQIDTSVFLDLGNWYSDAGTKLDKSKSLKDKIAKLKETIIEQNQIFTAISLEASNWRNVLDVLKIELEKEKEVVEKLNTKLLVSIELAHFSSNLHDDENCPLCGSLDHPSVMKTEDVSEQLKEVSEVLQNLEEKSKKLTIRNSTAEKTEETIARLGKELSDLQTELVALDVEISAHNSLFVWQDFDKDDKSAFDLKKEQFQTSQKQIKEKENEFVILQAQAKSCSEELKLIREKTTEINNQKTLKSGVKANELTQLKVLRFEDYILCSVVQLVRDKSELDTKNQTLEKDILDKTDKKSTLTNQLATNNGILIELKRQEEQLVVIIDETQNQLDGLLALNKYTSITQVQLILDSSIDIEKEKTKVQNYQVDLKTNTRSLEEAIVKLEGAIFSPEMFRLKTESVTETKGLFEVLFSEQAKRKGELEKMVLEFDKKATLLLAYSIVQTRLENLTTLNNLFTGNGFVKYVSSIYLQNLAEVANIRFHRITKNKLSLIINSDNQFEVIDYLNNGEKRSVKTLSGGQGFQASLCLALSLAESAQALNKNNKNFFFIDEGFGTQDAESVSLVYDTLQSLMKENRIVGFISHLTELQERIPRSITIFKDDDTGSFVVG